MVSSRIASNQLVLNLEIYPTGFSYTFIRRMIPNIRDSLLVLPWPFCWHLYDVAPVRQLMWPWQLRKYGRITAMVLDKKQSSVPNAGPVSPFGVLYSQPRLHHNEDLLLSWEPQPSSVTRVCPWDVVLPIDDVSCMLPSDPERWNHTSSSMSL